MSKKIRITQRLSTIGRIENQKATMKALGFRRIGQTVEHDDTACIRGMINKVRHIVTVEEGNGEG
jgi:large subunit ribosomal protein L30